MQLANMHIPLARFAQSKCTRRGVIQLFKQSLVSCQGLQAIRARFHARLARWASVEARHQLSALSRRSHVDAFPAAAQPVAGRIRATCGTATSIARTRLGSCVQFQLSHRDRRTLGYHRARERTLWKVIHRPALAHPQVASPATHPRFRAPTAAQTDVCRSEGGEALGHGMDERGTLEVEQGTGDLLSPRGNIMHRRSKIA